MSVAEGWGVSGEKEDEFVAREHTIYDAAGYVRPPLYVNPGNPWIFMLLPAAAFTCAQSNPVHAVLLAALRPHP